MKVFGVTWDLFLRTMKCGESRGYSTSEEIITKKTVKYIFGIKKRWKTLLLETLHHGKSINEMLKQHHYHISPSSNCISIGIHIKLIILKTKQIKLLKIMNIEIDNFYALVFSTFLFGVNISTNQVKNKRFWYKMLY